MLCTAVLLPVTGCKLDIESPESSGDGTLELNKGKITGRYFKDNNNNNLDDQEMAVANADVWLLDSAGQVIKQIKTNTNGEYMFDILAAGTYQVQFSAPLATAQFVTAMQGTDNTIDSDVISQTNTGEGLTAALTLVKDQVLMDIDAGVSDKLLSKATCIDTYDWPTAPGEAFLSDRYSVSFSQNGKTIPAQVIKSISKDIELTDSWVAQWKAISPGEERTFNWASFSSSFCDPMMSQLKT